MSDSPTRRARRAAEIAEIEDKIAETLVMLGPCGRFEPIEEKPSICATCRHDAGAHPAPEVAP